MEEQLNAKEQPAGEPYVYIPGALDELEEWWTRRRGWLEASGYKLRPRYQVDWKPSWRFGRYNYRNYEDGQMIPLGHMLDATRLSDGTQVMIKRIPTVPEKEEVEINQYLSSEHASDPRNHSAPLLDVLELPDDRERLIVMPLLRPYHDPSFETFGEAIAFFTQIFEGLQFMHERRIAHRDCTHNNIMLEPTGMYPDSFHPIQMNRRRDWNGRAKHYTRTQRPTRYLYVDFGLSRLYPDDRPALDIPVLGGADKSPPEHIEMKIPCDPFPTDIYYLGNLIRVQFMARYRGFSFMWPLVQHMIACDPSKRPKINEVVSRFAQIRASLDDRKLRSRLVPRKEWLIVRTWKSVGYWYRRLGYVVGKIPAIPDA